MVKVVILGGGMGGLSAAYELSERGFEVEVYEKRDIFGGKARSFAFENSGTNGRPDLPAEHGFRFFPGWYKHINDTASRIPYTGQGNATTVFDRFVEVPVFAYAMDGKNPFPLGTSLPNNLFEWQILLIALFGSPELGLDTDDVRFFVSRLLCFMGSGEKRRLEVYEKQSWWSFIDADNRSPQYRKVLATGLTRSLVATRAEDASTYTVGTILVQMMNSIIDNGLADRILDGPTNDVWIEPWRQELFGNGVVMKTNATVKSLTVSGNAVQSAKVEFDGAEHDIVADYFVCALPVEVVPNVLTPGQITAAGIDGITALKTAWMNGVMYYTNREVTMQFQNLQQKDGHTIYLDAPWAVTSISQAQFWKPEFDLANYGDGSVRDILSAIISEWDETGSKTTNKTARNAGSREEIKTEIWEQMKAARTLAGTGALADADLVASLLDPAIQDVGSVGGATNAEELLINTVDSLKDRPNAQTDIPNLLLAADYVITNTNLATMEAANEAGRRAANAILSQENSPPASHAEIFELEEHAAFEFWRDLDDQVFHPGTPFDAPICEIIDLLSSQLLLATTAYGMDAARSERVVADYIKASGDRDGDKISKEPVKH